MKKHILSFLLIIFSILLYSQNISEYKQTIRGQIVDEDTQSPIFGANILIAETDPLLGTVSDMDGYFRIENVPVGRLTVIVSYLGYDNLTLTNLLLGSGKELVLDISLTESFEQMDAVIITNAPDNKAKVQNEMAVVSAQSFSVEQTKRFAAGIGDPARLISAYAGATANGGDDENAIVIRGNSPRGLLWRLEGVEIPNPNHFASEGSSSGAVSILSSNTLSKSDFYTGAFPAEFGNALSGAFDIKLRNGNNEKKEYAFQASFLGLEAGLEGPFIKGKKASYLVNYRYSTLGLFSKMGINIVDEEESTNYQDAAFKFFIPSKKFGTFNLYGIGGLSEDKNVPTSTYNYSQTTNTNVGVIGMNHLYNLGAKSYIKSSISFSGTEVNSDETEQESNYLYESKEDKVKSYLRFGTKFRTKLSPKHILETGVTYSRLSYNFNETETETDSGVPESSEAFNNKGNSSSFQSYGSWKYKISKQLTFINGIHLLHFALNNKTAIEPRSALKWQFTRGQSLSFGFGLHSRIESLEYYLSNVTLADGSIIRPNTNLDFTKARHFVLSYDNLINKNWYIKTETYLQQLYDVPVSTDTSSYFSTLLLEDGFIADSLVNKGTGTNYGFELTVQRFFNEDFYFLFSASIYDAKYKASDGVERNTPFNSNYGFNALAGKEFAVGNSKQNLLGFNIRASFSGNKRYIPIDLEASIIEQEEVDDLTNPFAERYPDYWKIDFQVSYRINKANLTHELRLEFLNITDHNNIASKYYNNSTQSILEDTQTGLIPAIGYRIEF